MLGDLHRDHDPTDIAIVNGKMKKFSESRILKGENQLNNGHNSNHLVEINKNRSKPFEVKTELTCRLRRIHWFESFQNDRKVI